MASEGLYPAHVAARRETTEKVLAECGYDRLLVHSGLPFTYFADDNDAPFHPTPHFAHWAPVEGPGHLLEILPGKHPRLVRVTPRDFWYAPPAPAPAFVSGAIDVEDVTTFEDAWKRVSNGTASGKKTAFLGGPAELAAANGFPKDAINPEALVARLDWERSYKSPYEVETMAEAEKRAARGFAAAESAFRSGASEMEIHHAYLAAVGDAEEALPYTTIVGLDDRAATLHYHGKRGREAAPGRVLLLDAGASVRGYGSDITRTFLGESVDPVFRALRDGMERLQKRLVAEAQPGLPYPELHGRAHRYITELLCEAKVLVVSVEEALAKKLSLPFFPHGLGHFLGIQVHDVAGRQTARAGGTTPPSADWPALRTTRTIEEGFLFTIEPGLYFIPMLLEPHRAGEHRAAFDWGLIDRLTPFGGVRIEDDVFVGKDATRNLTREHLPA